MKAVQEREYTNYFKTYGYDEKEIADKLEATYQTFFYGSEEERIYHEFGEDMAYVVDTGNNDVRTEGMSYAMMMCVQRNMKAEFDRLWKWAKTYMWLSTGWNKGYFAWSVLPTGEKNSDGPAPDGEEYFAMALFFAAHRWGEGEGIFAYEKEARAILHECVHKGENGEGHPMWHPENKLIKFVPGLPFTDPSYHLPHFYELFALWANEEDREFWQEAAKASREFLKKACHPKTGLAAEYTEYDGSPRHQEGHGNYYSDAYRVIANIGLDYEWCGPFKWHSECADKIQTFFAKQVEEFESSQVKQQEQGNYDKCSREEVATPYKVYGIDGTIIEEAALHPIAIIATNAMGSLAARGEYSKFWIQKFWETPLRQGNRRYYDNCLYIFAFLALSGNYRIW